MKTFSEIREAAAEACGGEAALEASMPEDKSADQLRAISDDRWLAAMAKRIFQAGFVWKVIENKWPGFEEAFHRFDPGRLSMMSEDDFDRLLADERIVRNGQKIRAVQENALFLTDLRREHGSAAAFFAGWPDEDYAGLLEVLKKRGSRLGGTTGQIFLRTMGKPSFILSKDVVAALIGLGVVDKAPTSKRDMAAVQAAFNQWAAESGRSLSHISKTLALYAG